MLVLAQAPSWQKAFVLSPTSGYASVLALAADDADNVYLTGTFTGTVTLGTTTLTSAGSTDIFLAKWHAPTNSFSWVKQAGGTEADYPRTVAIAGPNVYLAGSYTGAAAFDGLRLTAGTSFGSTLFLAKLTDAGTMASFAWVQQGESTANNTIQALAVSGASLYITGTFYTSLKLGATTLRSAGPSDKADIFVAKLTDSGASATFTWAQQAGGTDNETSTTLAVTGTSVYIAGNTSSNPVTFGSATLPTAGGADLFVAKLTDNGSSAQFTWAQQAGGTGNDVASRLVSTGATLYLTGYFNSPALSLGTTTLINAGNYDAFVAKLTDAGTSGSFGWTQQVGGAGYEYGSALAYANNALYVGGTFSSTTLTLGSTTLPNTSTTGSGDIFLTKLSDGGARSSVTWAQSGGGPESDDLGGLAVAGATAYIGGVFTTSATFSPLTLASLGGRSGFLASLVDNTVLATRLPVSWEAALSCSPNPAHTTVTVQLPLLAGATRAELSVRDVLGRPLRTEQVLLGTAHKLDLRGLASGMYFLQVQVGASSTQRRFLLE
jgi:hypothetical protein